jgi:hypothetical protein
MLDFNDHQRFDFNQNPVGGCLKSPFGLKKNPRNKSVGDFCLFLEDYYLRVQQRQYGKYTIQTTSIIRSKLISRRYF